MHDARAVESLVLLGISPVTLPDNRSGIGVKQVIFLVEKNSLRRVIRTVQTEAVFEILYIEAEDNHRPGVADAECSRERKHGKGAGLLSVIQHKLCLCRLMTVQCEIDSAGNNSGTRLIIIARPHAEAFDYHRRLQFRVQRFSCSGIFPVLGNNLMETVLLSGGSRAIGICRGPEFLFFHQFPYCVCPFHESVSPSLRRKTAFRVFQYCKDVKSNVMACPDLFCPTSIFIPR